ncbi:MAG: 16S rRNA (cytidine(1402)-2'-O)-methyltransferase [candidate division Zixibacteria bacterium]|nr:16S rRNA (cytidine(1402)-2'-O)-methyltransferase [candidate division Zixibacteria bacterium]
MDNSNGKLYLVPTPIGNMGDITQRALEVLGEVDIVACEDTRRSGSLLKKLGLSKKLVSYHDFNESTRAGQLLDSIQEGKSVAVITDAGTPGISDPAYRVVRAAIDADIEIIPLPGPSSILPALTASGLPTDRFFFEGFLPNKSGARRTRLGKLLDIPHTLIFLESPHRVVKCLTDIQEQFGDRQACLAREITKLHEQFLRGSIGDILVAISGRSIKGEIVLVVAGADRRTSRKGAE